MKKLKDSEVEVSVSSGLSSVFRVGNDIYFYSEVDRDSVSQFIQCVDEIREHAFSNKKHFNLHISSDGGSVLDAFVIVDILQKHCVHTYVDGFVASAATLLLLCGENRYMSNNGFLLVHPMSSFAVGSYEQLKDNQKFNDMVYDRLVWFYVDNTDASYDEIKEMMNRDTYMDVSQAKERGFITHIIGKEIDERE